MRSSLGTAALVGLAGILVGAACVHQPPPLPTEPADVEGQVWTIQGSFEGGGTVVVRTAPVAAQGTPVASRLELRPGARILVRRHGTLRSANFSTIQLGQQVSAWWDGEPGASEGGGRAGPVRVLVIDLDAASPRPGG